MSRESRGGCRGRGCQQAKRGNSVWKKTWEEKDMREDWQGGGTTAEEPAKGEGHKLTVCGCGAKPLLWNECLELFSWHIHDHLCDQLLLLKTSVKLTKYFQVQSNQLHWKHTWKHEKRMQVLTHEITRQSRFYTYLHDQENRVGCFLEEKRHRISYSSHLSWSSCQAQPHGHTRKQPLEKIQSTEYQH